MNVINFFVLTLSTVFFVGYLPLMPGTFASLVGVFLFYLTKGYGSAYLFLTLALIILGFLVSGRSERILNRKDSRHIVIDEVSGMLLSFMFLPYEPGLVIAGFFVFRILDTFKPFPAARLQNLEGSLGVMGDDIVAGLYTCIVLQLALRLASFKVS